MKNKNKTIFVFLLAFTLLFSMSFVSAFGSTSFYIPDISDITTTEAGEVDVGINWDTDYLKLYIKLQIRESGESTWTDVVGSGKYKEWSLEDRSYTSSVGGLESNTEYEVRAEATEYCDTDTNMCYSGSLTSTYNTFTTDYEDPYVDNAFVENIGQTSAEFNARLNDMGSADSLEAFFEYREAGGSPISTRDTGEFTQTITSDFTFFDYTPTDLTAGTDYEVRGCVYDSNNNVEECGNYETFQTDSLNNPSVSTLSPTNINYESARLRGELDTLGDYSSVDVKFFSNKSGIMAGIPESETTLNSAGTYTFDLSGLGLGTTYKYYFSYYDTNAGEWVSSSEKTFTTLDFSDVSVNVDSATNITSNSAVLNGNVNLGDYENATARFQYREADIGSWTTTSEQNITTPGSYNQEITGLDSNKEYDFQGEIISYCSSSGCTSESITSSIISFTTDDIASTSPEIETLNTTGETYNSAIFNSKLTDVDEQTIGIFWEYRKAGSSIWNALDIKDVSSPSVNDEYSQEVLDLSPNTNYEVRAGVYSYSLDNNYYGDIETFTTESPEWEVTDKKTITSAEEFEKLINDLEPDSEYEFRAIMENGDKIYRGETLTFITDLTPPKIRNAIGSIILGFNEQKNIFISENYEYYDSFTLNIDGNNIYSDTNITNEEDKNVLRVEFDNEQIILKSFNTEKEYEASITISNDEGTEKDEFTISIEPSFFQKIVNSFTGIFPDSEELSSGGKFAYVFITMLVISLVMVAVGTTTGGVSSGIMIITGILNFLIFMFYTAIGYVSLWILVTLVLIAIAVSYFKSRGGE